ncbi:MAG: 30S ribosomal protein S7 [Patescibacteria group bacterium]|nr:30S ribosomal protein S7 [Patescibacteria group bacterium]
MARGRIISKRKLEPDPIYNSRLVTRFINRVMQSGKKTAAQKVVYDALEKIKEQSEKNPLQVFETALRNVSPRLEVRPRRVGGASYQVPMEVRGDRKEALAIRWLIVSAKQRPSTTYKSMADKLAAELIDASNNLGSAIKKKEDTHRMAEANKAFAHFRW